MQGGGEAKVKGHTLNEGYTDGPDRPHDIDRKDRKTGRTEIDKDRQTDTPGKTDKTQDTGQTDSQHRHDRPYKTDGKHRQEAEQKGQTETRQTGADQDRPGQTRTSGSYSVSVSSHLGLEELWDLDVRRVSPSAVTST